MQLTQIQDIQQQLNQKRHSEGSAACAQAYDLLAVCIEGGFTRREDFGKAIEAFARAIRYMRGAPEPYLGMGYSLMLMRDYPRAERYLMQVLRLAPQHPDALALLNALPGRKKAQPGLAPAAPKALQAADLADPDLLHDSLQQQIRSHLRGIMQQPPPQMQLRPESLAALREQSENLGGLLAQWHRHISELERHLEVSELRKSLKPFETAGHRLDKACKLVQQGIDLKADLHKNLLKVPPLFQQVARATAAADLTGMEAQIELFKDHCDALADRLDAIETQGLPLTELEPDYGKLVYLIEELAEEFDDKLTELKA